jgi:hypothetical protein
LSCYSNLLHLIKRRKIARLPAIIIKPVRQNTSKMKATTTLSALIAAVELAQATVYLAGDSTMADNGANDGVTDGSSTSSLPTSRPRMNYTNTTQAGAPTSNPTSSPAPP